MTPPRALLLALTLIGCKPLPSAMSSMPPSEPAPSDSASAAPTPPPSDAGPPPAIGLAPLQPAPEPTTAPPPEAPAAPPGPVEPGIVKTGAPTRGSLPPAVVDAKLKGAASDFRACYERALKLKPDLKGTVHIAFVVGTSGKVQHAEASEADDALDDAATVSCVLDVVRKLDFGPPKGGPAFLNYPLVLGGS